MLDRMAGRGDGRAGEIRLCEILGRRLGLGNRWGALRCQRLVSVRVRLVADRRFVGRSGGTSSDCGWIVGG